MESKLLYATAQQTNPWRAGTPGRAPRNGQAVVEFRRPLRFFVYAVLLLSALLLPAGPAHAQLFAPRSSIQLRIGALASTPLVKDLVSTAALDGAFPGRRSDEITVEQSVAPIATLALQMPLRARTQVEAALSAARSQVRGDDTVESWDVAPATIGTLSLNVGYLYKPRVAVRAGIGLTRMFVEEIGMFSEGTDLTPLIEVGASTGFAAGSRNIVLDLRVQSFSFGTEQLRNNSGANGNVTRASLQLGTSLWGGR